MDTKRIELLLEVTKIGSLKRAAEVLNFTQSGLIYQINLLEREVGVPLLNRNHKGVSLTRTGAMLEPYFRSVLDSTSKLDAEIENYTKRGSHDLNIGVVSSALKGWFAECLAKYQEKYPEVNINLYCGSSELQDWLDNELISFAILPEGRVSGHRWEFLYEDQIMACVPSNCPLAKKERLTYDDLREYPYIKSGYEESPVYSEVYRQLESNRSAKDTHSIAVSTTDGATLFPLVGHGLGITILADSYMDLCPPNVKMIPLEPPCSRRLGISICSTIIQSNDAKKCISFLRSNREN